VRNPQWSVVANMVQGNLAVGGRLAVREDVLAFAPNGPNRLVGGAAWSVPLAQVAGASVSPRTFREPFFRGGFRKRVRVSMGDGDEALFIVWSARRVVARLQASLEARPDSVE
jgi:hypothetical protein